MRRRWGIQFHIGGICSAKCAPWTGVLASMTLSARFRQCANSEAWHGRAADVIRSALLQPEPFLHEPLQTRFVEQVVSQLFVGEHGEGGAFGAGGQF